jgi:hypothetical protein
MDELKLDIEVLEERIAPAILTVNVPANPHADAHFPATVPHDGAIVNDAAIAADGANGVSVEL